MVHSLGLLDYNWYKSPESQPFLSQILESNQRSLKKFGVASDFFTFCRLLSTSHEHTSMKGYIDKISFTRRLKEFHYKVVLSGKSGCGKTSTAAMLGGYEVSRLHRETPGIEQTNLVWPTRLMGSKEPVVFRVKLCDAGETSISRFSHILSSMKENADAVVYFFSMTDRSSFEDIPQQMSRFSTSEISASNLAQIVIGTKIDLQGKMEVAQRDIIEFERQYDIPVLQISNMPIALQQNKTILDEVAPIMNCLCERLWYKDQKDAGLVI